MQEAPTPRPTGLREPKSAYDKEKRTASIHTGGMHSKRECSTVLTALLKSEAAFVASLLLLQQDTPPLSPVYSRSVHSLEKEPETQTYSQPSRHVSTNYAAHWCCRGCNNNLNATV